MFFFVVRHTPPSSLQLYRRCVIFVPHIDHGFVVVHFYDRLGVLMWLRLVGVLRVMITSRFRTPTLIHSVRMVVVVGIFHFHVHRVDWSGLVGSGLV